MMTARTTRASVIRRRLIRYTALILIKSALVSSAFGQDPPGTPPSAGPDSATMSDPEMIFMRPTLVLPPFHVSMDSIFPMSIRESFTAPMPTLRRIFAEETDLASIWQSKIAEQNDNQPLRSILSALELGGDVTIAYFHLHKFGFR